MTYLIFMFWIIVHNFVRIDLNFNFWKIYYHVLSWRKVFECLIQTEINSYLDRLEIFYNFSIEEDLQFEISSVVDYISNNFYIIDQNKLLNLPNKVFYLIISNENLRIKSEDALFDLVCEYIQNNSDMISSSFEISLLDAIEIINLS